MSVLTIHIDDGVFRSARSDDISLANLEVVTVVDGKPAASVQPLIEREIVRFVGEAREQTAMQMAMQALARLAERKLDARRFSSFDEMVAVWENAKSETDRQIEAARRLIYNGHVNAPKRVMRTAAE
jgi:type II secretory pathway predicted ATPase ExeA